MLKSEMPVGSVITLGHPGNNRLAVKTQDGRWLLLHSGEFLSEDSEDLLRPDWDDYIPVRTEIWAKGYETRTAWSHGLPWCDECLVKKDDHAPAGRCEHGKIPMYARERDWADAQRCGLAEANHIWVNAFALVNPSDDILQQIGRSVVNHLQQSPMTDDLIGRTKVTYIRLNAS